MAERLAELDDEYDILEYGRKYGRRTAAEVIAEVDADVIAEAHWLIAVPTAATGVPMTATGVPQPRGTR
ncbi:hypothetical protein [Streptomyces ficellus]|uniref:hypothetical protein n=1 Tax=Streptomyces ficellus TaxID=1977088 RepID=UPI00142EB837|nr:hypothetical protein [Streptomyces ficellus]